jgi:hypothetical protein
VGLKQLGEVGRLLLERLHANSELFTFKFDELSVLLRGFDQITSFFPLVLNSLEPKEALMDLLLCLVHDARLLKEVEKPLLLKSNEVKRLPLRIPALRNLLDHLRSFPRNSLDKLLLLDAHLLDGKCVHLGPLQLRLHFFISHLPSLDFFANGGQPLL